MEYYTILTDAGRALEAAALAGEKSFALSVCALGDGMGEPDPTATKLRHEVWRGALNSLYRDENNPTWLVMEAHVPAKDGGFVIREFGIYTDDGVLFAIGKHPETYKPTLEEGSGIEKIIRPICAVSSAASVTLLIDPSIVMASRKYVDESIANSEAALRKDGSAVHAHTIDQISGLRTELDAVIRLTKATTFYVRQDGSDSNDGLSAGTAVRSFSQIHKILRAVDSKGYSVTVDIGPGVWPAFSVPGGTNIHSLFIQGAGSNLTTIRGGDTYGITHAVSGCIVTIQAMTMAECYNCLDVRRQATAYIGNDLNFGTATQNHLCAAYGSLIAYSSSKDIPEWRISGAARSHLFAQFGSAISLSSCTITLEGAPNFSTGFARAELGGIIYFHNGTFKGSATGQRYYLNSNGVIAVNGAGADYFPGDRAGAIYNGGLYF